MKLAAMHRAKIGKGLSVRFMWREDISVGRMEVEWDPEPPHRLKGSLLAKYIRERATFLQLAAQATGQSISVADPGSITTAYPDGRMSRQVP